MGNIRLVYDVDEDSADYHARRLAIEGRKEILAYQKEIRLLTATLMQTVFDVTDEAITNCLTTAQSIYLKSLSLSPPEK